MRNLYLTTIYLLIFLNSENLFSEEIDYYVDTDFIIVFSSKSYNAAYDKAVKVSKKINYKIDLRNLECNKDIGLSYTRDFLENEEFGGNIGTYPWYDPRGRFDDGSYISIEYSNKYEGFSKGYYIVVASSGTKGTLKYELKKIKEKIPDAYIKTSKIYMGPMD